MPSRKRLTIYNNNMHDKTLKKDYATKRTKKKFLYAKKRKKKENIDERNYDKK